MNNDFNDFLDRELYPALFPFIDKAFPELHFTRRGSNWCSCIHFNTLEKDSQNNKLQVQVWERAPFCATDHNDSDNSRIELVNLYCQINNVKRAEAIRALCDICGIQPPKWTAAEWEQREKDARTNDARQAAQRIMQKALWKEDDTDAKEVLEYLRGRGWTDEEIDKAQLGYISPEVRAALPPEVQELIAEQKSIGTTHRLAITLWSSSRFYGFKFRDIHNTDESKLPKYINSAGTEKGKYLFGLPYCSELVIVEGELDALHAQAVGEILREEMEARNEADGTSEQYNYPQFAATCGGAASKEQIERAIRRGVKTFTLLFDNDKAGKENTKRTIKTIRETAKETDGVSVYVVEFPTYAKDKDKDKDKDIDESPNVKVKDIDEYLQHNPAEKVNRAEKITKFLLGNENKSICGEWRLTQIINPFVNWIRGDTKAGENPDTVTAARRDEVFHSIVDTVADEQHRQPLYDFIRERIQRNSELSGLSIAVDDIKRAVECRTAGIRKERLTAETERVKRDILKAETAEAIQEAIIAGADSLKAAKDASNNFEAVFRRKSAKDVMDNLAEYTQGTPTAYRFTHKGKEKHSEPLTLNTGLTFVCAATGHGKTSFLNCLAFDEARRNRKLENGKGVLYFTYEVPERSIIADMIILSMPEEAAHEISRNPALTLLSYLAAEQAKEPEELQYSFFKNHTTDGGQRAKETAEAVKRAAEEFAKEYIETGAIQVIGETYKVGELLRGIEYYTDRYEVSAIFIDYAQLIYKEGYSRQRTEEIKAVVNDIKNFANKRGLPIVLAAQFNREVVSPLSVDTKNIGEGGDFERVADTVIGLFNMEKQGNNIKEEKKDAIIKLLQSLCKGDFEAAKIYPNEDVTELKPIPHRIYIKLMKRRNGIAPLQALLEWDGATKRVKANATDEEQLFIKNAAQLFAEGEQEKERPQKSAAARALDAKYNN